MVGVTPSLRKSFFGIILVYFITGCVDVIVCLYFWSTPLKRRTIVVSNEQITIAFSIGIAMLISTFLAIISLYKKEKGRKLLAYFNLIIVFCLITTLTLGAYVWFESLDVRGGYEYRWSNWSPRIKEVFQSTDRCCGYRSSTDKAAISETCPQEIIDAGSLPGCSEKIFTFVNYYLKNIYTALFLFTVADVIALLASLVLNQALIDEARYNKSVEKIKNMHQFSPTQPDSANISIFANESMFDSKRVSKNLTSNFDPNSSLIFRANKL